MQQMLGAVPIYLQTDDKRIIDYLQKNITTHELNTGRQTISAKAIMYVPEIKGPKLEQVFICALVCAVVIYVFFQFCIQ